MKREPKIHKYLNDDAGQVKTACGIWIDSYTGRRLSIDADVRKVTCGNCQRTNKETA